MEDEEEEREGESVGLEEKSFQCPCCGSTVSTLLDPSEPSQSYVEDCSVCCRPLVVRYAFEEGALIDFEVIPS